MLREGVNLGVLCAGGLGRLGVEIQAQRLQLGRQGIAQRAPQLHQLLGKRIKLGVLGARGFGFLPGQRFLESGQRLLDFLAGAARVVTHLPSQFAFGPLHAVPDGLDVSQQLLVIRLPVRIHGRAAHHQPDADQKIANQQCQHHPGQGVNTHAGATSGFSGVSALPLVR